VSALAVARQAEPAPGRARMGWRGDCLTALLSTWLIAGVFLDAWAHNTRPSLETFFTPWHAVLYSGFLATGGWIAWSLGRGVRRAGSWAGGVPAGYGLAGAGILVFAVAGVGDMIWHLTFGVERNLAALLSPTHIGLFVGMLLIVTAPLRAAWAEPAGPPAGWRPLLPAALSLTLAGTLTAFVLQPFHPLAHNFASRRLAALILERSAGAPFVMGRNIQVGVAGFMLATVCLFVPLVLLLRRWRPPAGMTAAMLAVQCVLMQGSGGFREPELAAFGVVGALAVEAMARGLRPGAGSPGRLLAFCGLAPPAFWGIYLAGIAVRDEGLGWSPEVWGGTLIWTALALFGVGLALAPGPASAPTPAPRRA